jgi:hypothetical protein
MEKELPAAGTEDVVAVVVAGGEHSVSALGKRPLPTPEEVDSEGAAAAADDAEEVASGGAISKKPRTEPTPEEQGATEEHSSHTEFLTEARFEDEAVGPLTLRHLHVPPPHLFNQLIFKI